MIIIIRKIFLIDEVEKKKKKLDTNEDTNLKGAGHAALAVHRR